MPVFGRWEEARVPVEKPCIHWGEHADTFIRAFKSQCLEILDQVAPVKLAHAPQVFSLG